MCKGYGQAKAEADMYAEQLSLTSQLEILYGQAMQLALGRWRGSLAVEMDKKERHLILRYWTYVSTHHIRSRADIICAPLQPPSGARVSQLALTRAAARDYPPSSLQAADPLPALLLLLQLSHQIQTPRDRSSAAY